MRVRRCNIALRLALAIVGRYRRKQLQPGQQNTRGLSVTTHVHERYLIVYSGQLQLVN